MDRVDRAYGVAGRAVDLVRRGNRDLQTERMAWYPMDRARLVGLVTSENTGFRKLGFYFQKL